MAIGVTGVLVSPSGVSTRRISLSHIRAKVLTLAEAGVGTGGGAGGARGSTWHQHGAEDLTNLSADGD